MEQTVIRKYAIIGLLVLSLVGNAVLFSKDASGESAEVSMLSRTEAQAETLDFLRLFVEKVIQAPGEVSFDDRLKLENKIRELGNEELLAQWQAFVGSKSTANAEENLKALLGMLVKAI